ncbi:MAG: hypothetical protein DWQ02_07485 [Bacteroidetes bacterium]|nr:MAG: hypothetical protein DWQ02_07485 [Bacteroidota bacterium]
MTYYFLLSLQNLLKNNCFPNKNQFILKNEFPKYNYPSIYSNNCQIKPIFTMHEGNEEKRKQGHNNG